MHKNNYSKNYIENPPNLNLIIVYQTIVSHPPYLNIFSKDDNDFYGLLYTVKGKGSITIKEKNIEVNENQFIICHYEDIKLMKSDEKWEFFFFWFFPYNLNLPINKRKDCVFSIQDYNTSLQIIELLRLNSPSKTFLANSLFSNLLLNWLNNSEPKNKQLFKDEIYQCVLYINNNLDSPLHVKDLSKTYNMSEKHFRYIFKLYMKVTPKQYIENAKLEKALFLLKFSNDSITDISYNLCFARPSHFSYCFRKKYGKSPYQYRKN